MNEKQSETANVEFGIPQGSILGPTLFNPLVNDLIQTQCSSTCMQYADDTTLLYEHGTRKDLEECGKVEQNNVVARPMGI